MAKARRRLSDLVQEETQKIRETNLQTSEVTKSESLSANPSEAEDKITEQQTSNVTDLQTTEVTELVSQPESASATDSTPEAVAKQQTRNITDLQTTEVTKSDSLLETPSEVEDKLTEQQASNVTDLQTTEVTKPVSQPEPANRTNSKTKEVTEQQTFNITNLQTLEVTEPVSQPGFSSRTDSTPEAVAKQQTRNITDLQTSEVAESVFCKEIAIKREGEEINKATKLQSLKDTDLQSTELPKYLKLERKETRLRQDQIDALTDLTRKLNRTKRVKGGERLTDNTLIRVAVDLLLSKASELQGTTEEELRSSLGL
ncbi:hypothetical protein [Nostoc sp. FACHB-190]|uniref:hypothetical protein n=1 Tax=Nostoc sp. FACHB-190 TaxID=2692838 RepID=UPI001688068E|nr:hypothetical protein [Nostoc sp. FACHB-190]MBD2302213.1 hypothetical protein [Nostoc sp. FACHB-190]